MKIVVPVGLLALSLLCCSPTARADGAATFEIETNTDLGPVNRYVMGGNFEFISAQTPAVAALAQGMPIARFPGGDADSDFLWSAPMFTDPAQIFSSYSWDAFAQLALANHIDLFLEMNIVRGTPASAVAWIDNARSRGLNVSYVGIGNEPWGDWDAGFTVTGGSAVSVVNRARTYAELVRSYAEAIHARFPNIKVALEIGTHNEDVWNREAIRVASDLIDAVDYHFYPNHQECDPMDPSRCPNTMEVVGGADAIADNLQRIRQVIADEAPLQASRLKIVVGEWDGAADVPFPNPVANTRYMQWSMADALFYGVTIGEMLNSGVDAAMHYEVQGYRFGLIGGNFRRAADLTIHRPKEFALKLWREHFGDRSVRVNSISVPSYEQFGPTNWDGTAGTRDYVKTYASLAGNGRSLRLIVVNRHDTDAMQISLNLRDFLPTLVADVWSVAGDSILAQNENLGGPSNAVRILSSTAAAGGTTFNWTAPAHSVSAIELIREVVFTSGFE